MPPKVRILPGAPLARHPSLVSTCPDLERPPSVLTREKLQVLQGQEETRLWAHSRWVQVVTVPSKLAIGQNSYPCIIKKPPLSCSGLKQTFSQAMTGIKHNPIWTGLLHTTALRHWLRSLQKQSGFQPQRKCQNPPLRKGRHCRVRSRGSFNWLRPGHLEESDQPKHWNLGGL